MGKRGHGKGAVPDKVIIKALMNDGWYLHSQKGSHRMFKHPVKKGKISVPYVCSMNILMSALRHAGLKKKDLKL